MCEECSYFRKDSLKYTALAWGRDFQARIQDEKFRIHSTFRQTCNLQGTPGTPLLTVVAREDALGPNALWVEGLESFQVFAPGMPIACDGKSLCCGAIEIGLEKAVSWYLPALSRQAGKAAFKETKEWLENLMPGVTTVKSVSARQLSRGFANADEMDMAEAIGHFIGAGEGLTPAGDDFLAGFILAYERGHLSGLQENPLSETVKGLVEKFWGRTTVVSQTMLWYAAQGEGAAYVVKTVDAVYADSPAALNCAVRLAQIGASSGKYLLAGILAGCETFWLREQNISDK